MKEGNCIMYDVSARGVDESMINVLLLCHHVFKSLNDWVSTKVFFRGSTQDVKIQLLTRINKQES